MQPGDQFRIHRDNLAWGLEKIAEHQYQPYAVVVEALKALGGAEFLGEGVAESANDAYTANFNLYRACADRIRGCQTAEEVLEAYRAMLRQAGVATLATPEPASG
jgi:hypothetical protein